MTFRKNMTKTVVALTIIALTGTGTPAFAYGADVKAPPTKKTTHAATTVVAAPAFSTKFANNTKVNKDFEISGKITGVKAAQTIKVYIDKVAVETIKTDEKGQFTYLVPITKYKFAYHTLRLDAKLSNGKIISLSRTVNYTPFMIYNIDAIKENVVYTDKMVISGWALNYKGIKTINIYVDNMKKPVAATKTGLESPTVAEEYGNYKGSDKAAFSYELKIDTKKFKIGNHKVKVDIIGNDNTLKTKTYNVSFAERRPYFAVDGLKNGFVSDNQDIAVKGWFIAPDGAETVKAFLDDVEQTDVKFGLDREDIGAKYVDFATASKSGYELNLPINKIKRGAHKLRLEYSTAGTVVGSEIYDFTVKKPEGKLSVDKPVFTNTVAGKNLMLTGFGVHPSGVATIKVVVDGVDQTNIVVGQPNSTAEKKYPTFPGSAAAGYTTVVDASSWSLSQHEVKVILVAVDGEEVIYDKPMNLEGVTYAFMKNKLSYYKEKEYNRGRNVIARSGWVKATKDEIGMFLDPLTYMNDPQYKYVFMKLNYFEGISADMLNKVLVGKGVLEGKGQVFLDAGKEFNVNPIYLVSHALLETGNGKSTLAKGINVTAVQINQVDDVGNYLTFPVTTPKTVYNMFGIGAYDDDPNAFGSSMAYTGGTALNKYSEEDKVKALNGEFAWDTVEKAIRGGAKFISSGYICDTRYTASPILKDGVEYAGGPIYQQNTLYKMKWDLFAMDNEKFSVHQYATDVAWARSQTARIKLLIDQMGNPQVQFEVPIFVEE